MRQPYPRVVTSSGTVSSRISFTAASSGVTCSPNCLAADWPNWLADVVCSATACCGPVCWLCWHLSPLTGTTRRLLLCERCSVCSWEPHGQQFIRWPPFGLSRWIGPSSWRTWWHRRWAQLSLFPFVDSWSSIPDGKVYSTLPVSLKKSCFYIKMDAYVLSLLDQAASVWFGPFAGSSSSTKRPPVIHASPTRNAPTLRTPSVQALRRSVPPMCRGAPFWRRHVSGPSSLPTDAQSLAISLSSINCRRTSRRSCISTSKRYFVYLMRF